MQNTEHRAAAHSRLAWVKFILCNLIGIFVFFVTVPFQGSRTIPLDVLCQLATALVGPARRWLVLGVCVAGALLPFAKKSWNRSTTSIVFTLFKLFGAACAAMFLLDFGPRELLITDELYMKGAYTKKEAAIIATGFSTVSSTFMITVASTLGLMDRWNLYFWSTLLITFTVTAVTVRMYPLNRFPDEYREGVQPQPEHPVTKRRIHTALDTALTAAEQSGSLLKCIWKTFLSGLQMACTIVPSILSVGLIGMLLAMYTPLFQIIGYLFYPFAALVQLPEALTAAQALATSVAEMYLPCAFVMNCSLATRYVVAVGCISELLFFSAVIPCILSTSIPVKVPQMLFIWVERVIFSILLAGAAALILF